MTHTPYKENTTKLPFIHKFVCIIIYIVIMKFIDNNYCIIMS